MPIVVRIALIRGSSLDVPNFLLRGAQRTRASRLQGAGDEYTFISNCKMNARDISRPSLSGGERDRSMHYKEQRRTLPPPHHTLDKGEQVKWRLLQTNTYSAPSRLNLLYPQLYPSPTCPNCQQARGTICHMVLVCPKDPKPQDAQRLRDHPDPWETAIRASDAEGQRKLITLADEACRTIGTLDVGTTPG